MNAEIYGEDDLVTGVYVTDNRGVEHDIQLKRDGEIYAHHQDGYPDKAEKRTDEERNAIGRTRRFTLYYIHCERGYPTIDPYSDRDDIANPDRLAAATLVVGAMNTDTFREYFGDYYQQLRSHAGDAEPVITPPDVGELYRVVQDVYLTVDEDDREELLSVLREAEALAALEDALDAGALPDASDTGLVDRVRSALLARDDGPDADIREYADTVSDLYVEAVSPLRLEWSVSPRRDESRSAPGEMPAFDREPDARPQMIIADYGFDDIEEFQARLVHHLRCQLRDCYVAMGLRPPQNAQVRGTGIYTFANWFEHYDVYQPYHDSNKSIDWERLPPDPTRRA